MANLFELEYSNIRGLSVAAFGTLILSLFSFYTLKVYYLRKKYSHIPGPPANGLLGFFFGNAIEIAQNYQKERVAADLFLDWINKYGTTIRYQVLDKIIVLTVDQQAIKEIMIDRDFPKDSLYKFLGYSYGFRVLTGFISQFNFKGDQLLEKLRKLADENKAVKMMDEFSFTTFDIISHVAFGMDTDTLNNPNNNLSNCITEGFKGYQRFLVEKLLSFIPESINPSTILFKRSYEKVIKELRQLGKDQIMSRIKLIQDGSYVQSDLLSITLKESENEKLELEDMIDEFITFFIAGQETTTNTLSFCLIEIAKNAQVAAKLRKEIDSVLGKRNKITIEDLNKLNYVSSVIKETLRKWPPTPGTPRQIDTHDFKINGMHIPKNTTVLLLPYLSGRHEAFFKDPNEFKPERFLTKDNKITAYNYFPFSVGPRNCIGQNFAKIEMKILLIKLIQNFEFHLEANQKLGPVEHGTYRPIDGAKCIIKCLEN